VIFCIDLDDGTSNIHVYNNVHVNCAFKYREGDYRTVENNIIVNANAELMVLNDYNHDVFVRNIIITNWNSSYLWFTHPGSSVPYFAQFDYNTIYPARAGDSVYVTQCDGQYSNCQNYAPTQWQAKANYDKNSVFGKDPKLNYTTWQVAPDSPALQTGYKNFDTSWGPVGLARAEIERFLVVDQLRAPLQPTLTKSVRFASEFNNKRKPVVITS